MVILIDYLGQRPALVSRPVCCSTSENLALVIKVFFYNSSFPLTLSYMLPLLLLKSNSYSASVGTCKFLVYLSDKIIVRKQRQLWYEARQ